MRIIWEFLAEAAFAAVEGVMLRPLNFPPEVQNEYRRR
jgi:hypothetical protein